jgi:hypothetical protein
LECQSERVREIILLVVEDLLQTARHLGLKSAEIVEINWSLE